MLAGGGGYPDIPPNTVILTVGPPPQKGTPWFRKPPKYVLSVASASLKHLARIAEDYSA